jgi:hypothetical protein
VIGPLALVWGAAWLNRQAVGGQRDRALARWVMRYAYSFVPLGAGIWAAHYLFHLLVGPLTIWPAFQNFWLEVSGRSLLGQPDWALAGRWVLPLGVIQAVQMVAMAGGVAAAWWVAWRAAQAAHRERRAAQREWLPWAVILGLLAALGCAVFLLPMEMRGTVLG